MSWYSSNWYIGNWTGSNWFAPSVGTGAFTVISSSIPVSAFTNAATTFVQVNISLIIPTSISVTGRTHLARFPTISETISNIFIVDGRIKPQSTRLKRAAKVAILERTLAVRLGTKSWTRRL